MDAEEWERRRQAHQETKERGWTTVREAREMEEEIPVIISPSGKMTTPSGKKRPKTPSEEALFMSPSKSKLPPVPESPSKIQYNIQEIQEVQVIQDTPKKRTMKSKIKSKLRKIKSEQPVKVESPKAETVAEDTPKKGRTIKSKVKSQLRKIKSEQPAEIVDVELEAARKKGYDAHMKDKRARELVKAEKQGRRDAMTFKSRRVDDAKKLKKGVDTVAEKLEPVGKRVAKNVGKLMGEAKYTAKAAAKPQAKPARIATTTTTKPQAQRKEKPKLATQKGTLGRREGGYPAKQNRDGPGRRQETFGVKSKHGPTNNRPNAKLHRSAQPLPQNIPKSTHLGQKKSINFAMRARSKK